MVVVPGAYPCARPVSESTATILGSLEVQAICPSGKVAESPLSTAADKVMVSPTRSEPGEEIDIAAVIVVSAGGRRTRTLVLSRDSPLAATTHARPGLTARTQPVTESTCATPGLVEVQLELNPGTIRPSRSRTSASKCVEPPSTRARRGRPTIVTEPASLRRGAVGKGTAN